MAAPRKIFRIEEMALARPQRTGMPAAPLGLPPVAAAALEREQLARAADELVAVINGTAQATQKILACAEEIDQLANTLAAALRGKIEQDLAADISDLVIRIFEACNFQDVNGQRIAKVMKTLKSIETSARPAATAQSAPQAAAKAPAASAVAEFLHGPRLDGDGGHVSQSEIDIMFGC